MSVNVVARSRLRPDNASGRTSRVGRIPQDVLRIRVLPEESFGARIKRLRLARGLTLPQLAERAGVSARTIGYAEAGQKRGLTAQNFAALARALGVTMDALWDGTGPAS